MRIKSVAMIALAAGAILAPIALGLVLLLAPGLGEVRDLLTEAQPEWLLLAVAFEALSCVSYVLMFRPIFCARMSLRTSYRLGMSQLAVGSLVPASGAAGLAFGAWALRKRGMRVRAQIATDAGAARLGEVGLPAPLPATRKL